MNDLILIVVTAAVEIAVLYFLYSIIIQLKRIQKHSFMQTILLKKLLQKQGEDVSLDELNRWANEYIENN